MLNHLPDELILYVYPYIYLFHEKQFLYILNKHLLGLLHTTFIHDKENIKYSINEWTLLQYVLKQDYYRIMYSLPFINRYFLYLIIHFTIENNNPKLLNILVSDPRTMDLLKKYDKRYIDNVLHEIIFHIPKRLS